MIFAKLIYKPLFLAFFLIFANSCTSYKQFQEITQEFEIPSKIFPHTYALTWQAVVSVMTNEDLEVTDQEAGVLKTRWKDNTIELNFADSFGNSDSVKAAKYKLIITVVKGFRGGREVSKVTVFKRQMVEHDFLQGWKIIRSDGILEKAVLYRIERRLFIETKLQKLEEEKNKQIEQDLRE